MLRHSPLLPSPPSETRQCMCGFHFRSRPKVCRTQMNPGVKSWVLFTLWNIRMITLRTAEKRQFRSERSLRKKGRSSSAIVKTQWRWCALISLKDMAVVRSIEYMLPQVGQKRLWQRKGTNLRCPQLSQRYIAPPKAGSPQLIIFSTFSMTAERGCRV